MAVAAALDDADLADLVEFGLGIGMRIGEILSVRREVVDLEAGVLEVNAAVVRLKGRGLVLQERTKSEAGWRVIALPDNVVEVTTHTFRKSVATRLDDAGLTARQIADHLSHAKPSMTQDVYMGRGVACAEAAAALTKAAA